MSSVAAHSGFRFARWFTVVLLVVIGTKGTSPSVVRGSVNPPREDLPFSHGYHVASSWMNLEVTEVSRDCRGCHDPKAPAQGLEQTCIKCHTGGDFTTKGRYRPLSPPTAGFAHGDHTALTCRECHAPREAGTTPGQMLSPSRPIPIRRGIGECSRCHGPEGAEYVDPFAFIDPENEPPPGSVQEALDRNPAMRCEELGSFVHGEHMFDPGAVTSMAALLGDGAADRGCLVCHGPLRSSRELGTVFEPDACAWCHITEEQQRPVRFSANASLPSWTLGAFSHQDHLRPVDLPRAGPPRADESAFDRLADQGCAACHEHSQNETSVEQKAGSEFGFSQDLPAYEGCAACHAVEYLQPSRHGDWGRKGADLANDGSRGCAGCHTFGTETEEFPRSTPRVSVSRPRPVTFDIRTQSHPMIGEGELPPDSCVVCHRAPVTGLRSRIQQKKFDHATHLPREASSENCLRCHEAAVASTRGPEQLGFSDGLQTQGLTYDPTACGECHRGSEPKPNFDPTGEVEALLFSHESHLGRDHPAFGPVDCETCHQSRSGPSDRYFETLTCDHCHNHEEWSQLSGDMNVQSTRTCGRCHVARIPEIGEVIANVRRNRISDCFGTQHHPKDRACTDCHLDERIELELRASVTTDSANVRGQIHKVRPTGGFEDEQCLSCHWSGRQRARPMRLDPDDEAIRSQYGAVLEDYPGVPEDE